MEKGNNSGKNKKCTKQTGFEKPTDASAHDWQGAKSLTECLDQIFSQEIGSDVTFVVGQEKDRISAHKLILSSRSKVFFSMFNGPWKEEDVELADITEDSFRQFLCFLYTDEIDLTVERVVPVMSVARKYLVEILVDRCDKFVQKSLAPANACFFLEKAHIYTEEKIREKCLHIIYTSPKAAMETESFADLCPECLDYITESDDLAVDESTVYNAMMKWAQRECVRQSINSTSEDKRNVLGNVFRNIRFPVMNMMFFLDNVLVDGILKNDEIVDILKYMRDNDKGLVTSFNKKERRAVHNNASFGSAFGSAPFFGSKNVIFGGLPSTN